MLIWFVPFLTVRSNYAEDGPRVRSDQEGRSQALLSSANGEIVGAYTNVNHHDLLEQRVVQSGVKGVESFVGDLA
jgi:hypothetical protein